MALKTAVLIYFCVFKGRRSPGPGRGSGCGAFGTFRPGGAPEVHPSSQYSPAGGRAVALLLLTAEGKFTAHEFASCFFVLEVRRSKGTFLFTPPANQRATETAPGAHVGGRGASASTSSHRPHSRDTAVIITAGDNAPAAGCDNRRREPAVASCESLQRLCE